MSVHQEEQNTIDILIRKVMEKHPDIRLSILFGSLAHNEARAESDLDLAVSADAPLDSASKMQLIEDLAAATGRPVDLVDLRSAGEPLTGEILRKGRRITGDPSRHAFYITRHLLDQADFMPYRKRILDERRTAWIGR
ncbi:MAG: nucleotidyltransferase domain-containing protein [Chlorobium sp.]|nr:MAG: nucleotidyltransferase domain-containing protein [Chlorobium sp.]